VLEKVRLNALSSDEMQQLLTEERFFLQQKFQWDTQYTFKLRIQLLKYGRMDGLAAVLESKPVGYINWHHFDSELYLSGYYFSKLLNPEYELDFLDYAASFIARNFNSSVIEGQLLCIDDSSKSEIFERNSFITVERNYMVLELSSFEKVGGMYKLPDPITMCDLEKEDFDIIADLSDSMCKSYKGTMDEWITSSFGSFQGCRNFITNLFEFPVYGRLQENLSILIRDSDNQIAAMILVCKSSNTAAHIVQVSVTPEYQSKGIGKFILNECIMKLKDAGYKNAVLMVTKQNSRACNLYRKFGFESISSFYSINYNKLKK
jgi:GNAT superfamily N-acetyltransferase